MMPTLCALRRMLSSDIKPLKAGLQEKTQSSLILCVTWHLFGAAFLLHRVWRGIQIGKHRQESTKSKWWCEEDPSAVIQFHTWTTDCVEHHSILAFRLGQILMRGKSELISCIGYNVHVLKSEALMWDYEVLISLSAQAADHLQC